MAVKTFSIRIDSDKLDKLHYIANYEGRSASGQILQMIKVMIREFEEEHGTIDFKRNAK